VATLNPFSNVVTLTSGTYPKAGAKLCSSGVGLPYLTKTSWFGSLSGATTDDDEYKTRESTTLLEAAAALLLMLP
jgi:hypothetical protein